MRVHLIICQNNLCKSYRMRKKLENPVDNTDGKIKHKLVVGADFIRVNDTDMYLFLTNTQYLFDKVRGLRLDSYEICGCVTGMSTEIITYLKLIACKQEDK